VTSAALYRLLHWGLGPRAFPEIIVPSGELARPSGKRIVAVSYVTAKRGDGPGVYRHAFVDPPRLLDLDPHGDVKSAVIRGSIVGLGRCVDFELDDGLVMQAPELVVCASVADLSDHARSPVFLGSLVGRPPLAIEHSGPPGSLTPFIDSHGIHG